MSSQESKKKKKASSDEEKKSHPLEFSSLDEQELRLGKKKGEKAPLEFSALKKSELATHFEPYQEESYKQHKELYARAIRLAEKVYQRKEKITAADINAMDTILNELIVCTKDGRQELVCFLFLPQPPEANFYVLNLVNVCILALEVGVGLKYSDTELFQLGVVAFLHDVGQKDHLTLITQPKKFTLEEKKEIQKHPLASHDHLHDFTDRISSLMRLSIEQEHERMDGSGYPRNVSGNDITEFAQIIGLVDVYEALTHSRPFRDKYPPSEALKMLIESKKKFSPRILKIFLERIGIYPRGTFVELNTREIAQVIHQNFRMPCCPVVRVVCDAHKKEVQNKRTIDLSQGTTIYIIRSTRSLS